MGAGRLDDATGLAGSLTPGRLPSMNLTLDFLACHLDWMKMRRFAPITLLAVVAITPSASLAAEDFRVKSAAALDGRVECFAHQATATGPCEAFTPPARVSLGESFAANGKERQIGVIVASQAEKDMPENGLDIRKGEWTCVAAETVGNIPSDENQDQNLTWLFIPKCQPEL